MRQRDEHCTQQQVDEESHIVVLHVHYCEVTECEGLRECSLLIFSSTPGITPRLDHFTALTGEGGREGADLKGLSHFKDTSLIGSRYFVFSDKCLNK